MHIVSRQPSKPRHDRVAPLAVLPVFFDLAGKRVVAIGGSEAATWKIELTDGENVIEAIAGDVTDKVVWSYTDKVQ